VFLLSLIVAIGLFILRSLENPHGEPDAWTFWNSRARLFFRSGSEWRHVFSQGSWLFPTYPLLIPTNVVRVWSYSGKETLAGPAIIAFFFTVATIGLLVSALIILRGRTQGYLGGCILASTPYFIKHGASQYADVPFGFYVLATVILVNLQDEVSEKVSGVGWLTGICTGLAAWTKSEGLLFLICVLAARFIVIGIFKLQGRSSVFFREAKSFIAGICPILLGIGYFRMFIAPQNPPRPSDVQHILDRLSDLSRYLYTAKAFFRQIIEPYSLVYSTPIVIFFFYALFLGVKLKSLKRAGVMTSLFILGLMFCGYFLVYITTPHDLAWLIGTTLSRLFLQLWPSLVFIFLLIIATPEERTSY
jgi:hypothetical protein